MKQPTLEEALHFKYLYEISGWKRTTTSPLYECISGGIIIHTTSSYITSIIIHAMGSDDWSFTPGTTASIIEERSKTPRVPIKEKKGGGHQPNNYHPESTAPANHWMCTYSTSKHEESMWEESKRNPADLPNLPFDYMEEPDISWFVGQWEWETGKGLHVQFAVGLVRAMRVTQVRRLLNCTGNMSGLWLEPIKFGKRAAINYCSKEDTRVAVLPRKGKTEVAKPEETKHHGPVLEPMYQDIVAGMPIYEVAKKYPRHFGRAHAGIAKMCALFDKPRARIRATVIVLFGVTGSGKSDWALKNYPNAYRKTIPGKWWDGYQGQTSVIFEEFNPTDDKELKLPQLLTYLDEYPVQVEVKGCATQLKANTFIITTNLHPNEWYPNHAQQGALARRITKVLHFRLEWRERERMIEEGLIEPEDDPLEYDGMSMSGLTLA